MVFAIYGEKGPWLMGLSFLLTIISAVGGVEDLNPWLESASCRSFVIFRMVYKVDFGDVNLHAEILYRFQFLSVPAIAPYWTQNATAAMNYRTPNRPRLVFRTSSGKLIGFPSCGCKCRGWG